MTYSLLFQWQLQPPRSHSDPGFSPWPPCIFLCTAAPFPALPSEFLLLTFLFINICLSIKQCKKYGATRFRYCDTLGYDDPQTAYDRIYAIAKETGMEMEMHFHNDLGMATACSVMGAKAAIDAGVDAWINTAINGMGERAGNADLVSCILAIKKSSGFQDKYQIDPQIDISKTWKLAK